MERRGFLGVLAAIAATPRLAINALRPKPDNTSIWLVGWGEHGVIMVSPSTTQVDADCDGDWDEEGDDWDDDEDDEARGTHVYTRDEQGNVTVTPVDR